MSIPKINKQIKLYEEAEEPYISKGAGYEIPDRIMGKDNVVLAGHDYPELLEDLDQIEMGDKMFVLENNQVFMFEVNSIFKAEEKNVHDLKQIRENQKEPMLTVYTCFGGQNTPIRTVVQAKLVNQEMYQPDNQAMKELFSIKTN
ncbi:sortase [Vagococcus fluvialis]|uniref:Sortase n=1 Tax=Vagococcus fluvialis TaxID=2738 RepID=A0A7X6D9Y2_9ENTE|nr:sortase [Vagococcus fluvialis]NKC68480.1 sortase [Vagococcus fluvialis]